MASSTTIAADELVSISLKTAPMPVQPMSPEKVKHARFVKLVHVSHSHLRYVGQFVGVGKVARVDGVAVPHEEQLCELALLVYLNCKTSPLKMNSSCTFALPSLGVKSHSTT
jgi:hypothetical protein